MKIVGCLSWWDESPGWLATAVSGFARVCDSIVAVDGAYCLTPGGRPASHPQQAEAIIGAAEAAGVACTIHRPSDLFYGNECEKRNFLIQLAGVGLTENDFLLVFDADLHVFKCEPEAVRWELENTECLAATYTVLDGQDMLSDPEVAEYAKRDNFDTEWTIKTKDIYRWHQSLMYGPQHWMVSRDIGGERKWLRHSVPGVPPWLDLNASLVAYHRSQDRALVRKMVQAEYYKARELHGVEPASDAVPEVVLT